MTGEEDNDDRLRQFADILRGYMDAAEYKHVILGLIFLKYISDVFEEQRSKLLSKQTSGADPENPDEYRANNVSWIPKPARWAHLQANAEQPNIGKLIDDAMRAIEDSNKPLKDIFPKVYARPALEKPLGQLIDLIGTIGLGDAANRSKGIPGRVFEYFLSQFAGAESKKGGEFYTPQFIAQLLVEMLAPYKGRVFDPCCGSGGMLVQCEKFLEDHGGKVGDIAIYGQETNPATRSLAGMNLAIRGVNANLGPGHGDSLLYDMHPDLEADYIMANPPFNVSGWGEDRLKDDKRWKYGLPPASNANFAWVQHFIHHLAPTGLAGFVLPNGSMSSTQPKEEQIRRNIIEADLVDCMVALPGQLLYSTQIPVCLWLIARDKGDARFRHRRGETLFIDARDMGTTMDRVHRELTDEDINRITVTYHAWRGDIRTRHVVPGIDYADAPGFCKAVSLDIIRHNSYILTPGRYVGTAEVEEEEPFAAKMKRLAALLEKQQEEGAKLDETIKKDLAQLGFGV